MKNEQILREMYCVKICVMGIPKGEDREEAEKIFKEIMTEKFPNLIKTKH